LIAIERPGGSVKFNKTKDISTLGVKFDGWEVLLAGSVVCLIVALTYPKLQVPLFWTSGGLFVLWIVMVFVANIFLRPKRAPGEGGGGALGPAGANPPGKQG
jgi:hypothetical protein